MSTVPNSLSWRRDCSISTAPERFGCAGTTRATTNPKPSKISAGNQTGSRRVIISSLFYDGSGRQVAASGMRHQGWVFGAARKLGGLAGELRRAAGAWNKAAPPEVPALAPRIGLALGGGFARGIAHAGVLKVFEQNHIPIHCVTGVSAGSIVAAAYASGASPTEIATAGCAMRFCDVARWSISRMGFVV